MGQNTSGIRSVLSTAWGYSAFQNLVGAKGARLALARTFIQAQPKERILDIGCGPGEILEHLGDVDYLGFDANPAYIDAARRRYGERGRFMCQVVEEAGLKGEQEFDIVLALGVLHHLDDDAARELFSLAQGSLRPGGRLVSIDNCYRDGQSSVARYLIQKDRGKNVRTESRYVELARKSFVNVESVIREDLLRIPYTHVILRCSN